MFVRMLSALALLALASAVSADEPQPDHPTIPLFCAPIAPPIEGPSTDIGDPILPVNRV